uniref:Integrase catalytic domain-containing protein n=1 Tax=Tanacetum cinerariifolium TaxID=118510 RepID=A0A6L2NP31_TANCI|nr:hypothetical protein [Tanacetum cinerariifolium]
MEKTISEVHSLIIKFKKSIKGNKQPIVGASSTPQVMAIQGGRVQNYKRQDKAKEKGEGPQNSYHTKPKKPQPYKKECMAKDGQCHHCKEEGHGKGSVLCIQGVKKLKHGSLYLYVGNGVCAHVSKKGASHFITFTGDYSHYGYVYLLKHTHEVFETFKVFKSEVENRLRKTIKVIRYDHGGEYISQELKDYLKACGIIQQLTPPYTPQHNGVSERLNRTLLNMVRSMMSLATLPLSFWDYALEFVARILNMVPTKKVDKTPDELWHGKVLNLSYLKETMSYYFYYPPENKIVFERYANFLEKDFIHRKESGRIVELEDEDILPSNNTSEHPIMEESLASILCQEEDVIHVHRSLKTHKAPNRLCLNVEIDPDRLCFNVEVEEHSLRDLNEHSNCKVALSDLEFKKWLVAMNAEMQSMYDNKVYRLVVLRPNAKVVKKMKRMHNIPYASVVRSIMYAYLINIKDTFLVYGGDPKAKLRVNCYCDVGFKTDRDDTNSQTGYVFILNGGAVVWKSSKQSTTAQHATKAEYIAASEAAKEAVWIRKFIDELGVVPSNDYRIKINGDNSAAIIMTKESGI